MEDIGPTLFTPVASGGETAAGILPGIRNRAPGKIPNNQPRDVTCEHCGKVYLLHRLRPCRKKRRLCATCRSRAAIRVLHDRFTTPDGERDARIRANGIVNTRYRRGWFEKPELCMRCHKKPRKMEGHHTDYSKPDQVLWLCHGCHFMSHVDPKTVEGITPFICYDRRTAAEKQQRHSPTGGPR